MPLLGREIPGINIQWPWSQMLLSGKKTIETRSYDIKKGYLNKDLALIETPGPKGRKEAGIEQARIIGIIVFSKTYRYVNFEHWKAEACAHFVDENDSPYSWRDGRAAWAWQVDSIIEFDKPAPAPLRKGIIYTRRCFI